MKIKFNTFEILIGAVLLISFIHVAVRFNALPDPMPVHFNIDGEADQYGSRWFAWLMPGMGLLIYFILRIIPRIDPRWENYKLFSRSYNFIRLAVQLLLSSLTIFITEIFIDFHPQEVQFKWVMVLIFTFFAVMGNFMRTIRSNYFAGIRTPWTLENEQVWKRTHEVGGRLWFYAGLLLALITTLLPSDKLAMFMLAPLMIIAIYPVAYSYWYYQKLKKENSNSSSSH